MRVMQPKPRRDRAVAQGRAEGARGNNIDIVMMPLIAGC